MITLTSALRTAVAAGLLLACSSGTALAAPNAIAFSSPGEYPIVIPAGVTSLHVVAVGGSGGEGTYSVPGGFGARVTATLPVSGGMTRWLLVGGNGVSGVGRAGAGGGGGASDVRTAPSSAGITPTDPRILIAAGGGGSGWGRLHGVNGSAGYGGAAGAPGGDSRLSTYPGSITSGGGAAAAPLGTGAGGTSGAVDGGGSTGGSGSLGLGGDGAYAYEERGWTPGGFNGGGHGGGATVLVDNASLYGGGGGGGGRYGGGGGGGVRIPNTNVLNAEGGAGGAGGSNLVPAGGSAVTDDSGSPSITISFEDTTAPIVGLDAVPARVGLPVVLRGTSGTVLGDGGVAVKVYAGATAGGAALRTIGAGRDATTGSWQVSLSDLAPGHYTARAEQTDGAGHVGLSATRTFVIDTVAPAVSLTSPADGTLTNSRTPSFGGTAGTAPGDGPAVELEIRSEGGAVVETVSAQRDGTTGAYTAAASSPLADGAYTAVAAQSDDVGNRGRSSTVRFQVDAQGPAPTLTTRPDARTRVATPSFAGTAGTAAGDLPAVSVRIHAGAEASGAPVAALDAAVDGSGRFQVTSTALADGTYTAVVAQADGAGNPGSSAPATFTVDTTAPALTLATPTAAGRTAPKPAFTGAGGTAPGDDATVTIRVHAGSSTVGPLVQTLTATRDPQSGAYQATSPFELAIGTYTVVAAQVDDVGNAAATAARTFTVDGSAADGDRDRSRDGDGGRDRAGDGDSADRTKPVLSRVSLSPARFKVGGAKTALTARAAAKALKRGTSVRYTLSERATVTLAIARAGQRKPVGTLTRRSRQGANRVAFSGRLGSKALKAGRYVLTLTAVDAAGNRSAAKKVSFRIG